MLPVITLDIFVYLKTLNQCKRKAPQYRGSEGRWKGGLRDKVRMAPHPLLQSLQERYISGVPRPHALLVLKRNMVSGDGLWAPHNIHCTSYHRGPCSATFTGGCRADSLTSMVMMPVRFSSTKSQMILLLKNWTGSHWDREGQGAFWLCSSTHSSPHNNRALRQPKEPTKHRVTPQHSERRGTKTNSQNSNVFSLNSSPFYP